MVRGGHSKETRLLVMAFAGSSTLAIIEDLVLVDGMELSTPISPGGHYNRVLSARYDQSHSFKLTTVLFSIHTLSTIKAIGCPI